jgi:hypothetical protein
MVNKPETIQQNFNEGENKKVEQPNMFRVMAVTKATTAFYDMLKEHASSLTDADMERVVLSMNKEFEEYLGILLEKRKKAFERRKERANG